MVLMAGDPQFGPAPDLVARRPRATVTPQIPRDPVALLAQRHAHLRALLERLRSAQKRDLERDAARLAELARTLHAVSPLATLERGYAILLDAGSGLVVRSVAQVSEGQALRARLADGQVALRAEKN